jgi:hypothetical protein
MTKAHFVKKARKDYPDAGIKAGEGYHWWKFNFQKHIYRSKTAPTRQQLTKSDFLSHVYDIEDHIGNLSTDDDLAGEVESIVSEIEELSSETEDKLNNMPEQLQENSSSGQLLQERIDSLSEFQSDLEGIDTDADEDGIKEEETNAYIDEKAKEKNIDRIKVIEALTPEEHQELRKKTDDAIKARKEEIIEELQGISYGGS